MAQLSVSGRRGQGRGGATAAYIDDFLMFVHCLHPAALHGWVCRRAQAAWEGRQLLRAQAAWEGEGRQLLRLATLTNIHSGLSQGAGGKGGGGAAAAEADNAALSAQIEELTSLVRFYEKKVSTMSERLAMGGGAGGAGELPPVLMDKCGGAGLGWVPWCWWCRWTLPVAFVSRLMDKCGVAGNRWGPWCWWCKCTCRAE
eukprot:scaffold21292_cov18-Tisochrysis_lutea.AAC.1